LNPILFTMKLQIDRYSFIGNENGRLSFNQGRTGHCGNAANVARLFFENAWHFKDIREFEAFLNYGKAFSRIARLFKHICSRIESFLK
jgi:hypothetical protein